MKIFALGLLWSVSALAAEPTSSAQMKKVLFDKLSARQDKADGLYSISEGVLRVGEHTVDLVPVVETETTMQGKNIMAMRIEVAVDGVPRPEATFGEIGIATSPEEAITASLGEWYLGLGEPLFRMLGDKPPSTSVPGYEVFAGALGLRGGSLSGWMDSTEAMNQKILAAVSPAIPSQAEDVMLDLKVMVPAWGSPESECRVNGTVSPVMAKTLIGMDWPRENERYIFKQVYLLRKKNGQEGTAGK